MSREKNTYMCIRILRNNIIGINGKNIGKICFHDQHRITLKRNVQNTILII